MGDCEAKAEGLWVDSRLEQAVMINRSSTVLHVLLQFQQGQSTFVSLKYVCMYVRMNVFGKVRQKTNRRRIALGLQQLTTTNQSAHRDGCHSGHFVAPPPRHETCIVTFHRIYGTNNICVLSQYCALQRKLVAFTLCVYRRSTICTVVEGNLPFHSFHFFDSALISSYQTIHLISTQSHIAVKKGSPMFGHL